MNSIHLFITFFPRMTVSLSGILILAPTLETLRLLVILKVAPVTWSFKHNGTFRMKKAIPEVPLIPKVLADTCGGT